MKKKKGVHGVIVPMVTPFKDDGRLDESAVERILDFFLEAGVFPFVLGTTGEAASVHETMRHRLVNLAAKQTAGKTALYAGISSNCFEASLEAAEKYLDLGVYAVVAHLPNYYPLSSEDIFRYFEVLADHVSGPLVVYNIPQTTHMSIPLDVLENLSRHPNITGVKDSERDLERLEKAIGLWAGRDDFSHLTGWGGQMAHALSLGTDGIVPSTGNLVPGKFAEMVKAADAGDREKAIRIQERTDEISMVYQKGRLQGQSLAALKVMMHEAGLCDPAVLPPLFKLGEEETTAIQTAMKSLGISGKAV
jgi:dihydrodipicolinate synthase/N-acetylneuraminate lyase